MAAQTGAIGRPIVQRCDDAQPAFRQLLEFKTDAVVAAARLLVELVGILLRQVGTVRIEIQQQATHRRLHQRMIVDRIHVGLLDRVVDHHVAANLVQRHLGIIGLRRVRIVAGGDLAGLLRHVARRLRCRLCQRMRGRTAQCGGDQQ